MAAVRELGFESPPAGVHKAMTFHGRVEDESLENCRLLSYAGQLHVSCCGLLHTELF